MHLFRSCLLLLLLAIFYGTVAGEGFSRCFYLEPSYYRGSVFPQNNSIRYLVNEHLQAWQLNIGIPADGSKKWHQYLNYPLMGVGIHHSTLGNNEVFGRVTAIYGTTAIKTFLPDLPVNLEHHLTAGFGFLSKHYDLKKNPLNMAFGGPVVFFLQYALLVPVRLGKSVEIFAGPCFSHFSAGKIIQPNLGLHMLQIRTGARYTINPVNYTRRPAHIPLCAAERHQLMLSVAAGIKQYSRFASDKDLLFTLSPQYHFALSHVFGIGGGFDIYLDNSVRSFLQEQFRKNARLDQLVHASVYSSFQLKIGDLAFLIQPGTYILKNIDDFHNRAIYKLGFRYQISPRISAEALLKAYWLAKADFLGFGVGYSFLKK